MKSFSRRYFTCRQTQNGKINWLSVILLMGIAAVIFFSVKFVPPYSTDYSFGHFLKTQSRNGYEWTDDRIRLNINEYCAKENIALQDENWTVYRNDKILTIRVKYRVIVELPLVQDRVLRFNHDISQEIMERKTI